MLIQPLILAAGKGTRMKSSISKVLIPVQGKPIIQHTIDALAPLTSTTKPIVVVGDNKHEIESVLSDKVSYAIQHQPQGTGHAVMSACDHLTLPYTLICYGDHPFFQTETLAQFEQTIPTKPTCVIGTVRVPHYDNWYNTFFHWGRIIRHNNTVHCVTEFKDATPKEKRITEVNASPYLFETQWLKNNVHALQNNNAQSEFYLTDLIARAQADHHVQTITIPATQAIGINTQKQLSDAINRIKKAEITS